MNPDARAESALDRFERLYGTSRWVAVAANALGLLICPILYWLMVMESTHDMAYHWLVDKLGVVGFPYTLSFVLAGILGVRLALAARRRGERRMVVWTFLGMAAFSIFVAGEHISWGQAIVMYKTPFGLGRINELGRFNVHNMPGFDEMHSVFLVICGIAGFIGLRLASVPRFQTVALPTVLTPIVWVIFIMSVMQIVTDILLLPFKFSFTVFVLRYAVEFLIGLTCLLYVWLNGRRLRRRWDGAEAG